MVKLGLREKVISFIKEEGLFCIGDKIIVAVSGGQDSVTLLNLLYELRHELGISLIVAHYNHALRKGAANDQLFVKMLAEKMGIPLVTETNRVRLPPHVSIEEFARHRRYAFFKKTVRVRRAACVALAHTRDDLAETVLMRILRGTGLAGLRAMLPKREIRGMRVIRPLLAVSRAEVESYIRDNNLRFVQDPSNCSLDFFRNRIRLKILPYLEKNIGYDVKSNLASLASIAASDYDLLDGQSQESFKAIARKRNYAILLSLNNFVSLHSALRRSLIRLAIAEVNGDLNAVGQEHIGAVERLALRGQSGISLDLPKNIVANVSMSNLVLRRKRY